MRDDLVRLEYKLDLIIHALQLSGIMAPELPSLYDIEQDACPVCGTNVSLQADYGTETLQYKCGCDLPVKVVPGIATLTVSNTTDEEKPDGYSRTTENSEVLQPKTDSSSGS